jgi:hypothetical protein
MLSKQSAIWAAVSLVAVAAAVVDAAMFAPDSIVYSREIKGGNKIVRSIDVFRERERRLPASLSEVGISGKDQNRYFYEPCTNGRYIVWFCTRLGESMTYDSAIHKWDSLNIPCDGARAPSNLEPSDLIDAKKVR